MDNEKTAVGQNVTMQLSPDGKKLTVEIDLTGNLGPSSSGKTLIVATTGGNADVPGKPGMKIGVNVYRKP